MRMFELINSVQEKVRERRGELLESPYPEDTIHEIADSWVPIYNADLAELLAENPGLAYPEDDVFGGETPDVFRLLMWTVYEQLSQAAHEEWRTIEEEVNEAA